MYQIKTLISIDTEEFLCNDIRIPITIEIGMFNSRIKDIICTPEFQRIHVLRISYGPLNYKEFSGVLIQGLSII